MVQVSNFQSRTASRIDEPVGKTSSCCRGFCSRGQDFPPWQCIQSCYAPYCTIVFLHRLCCCLPRTDCVLSGSGPSERRLDRRLVLDKGACVQAFYYQHIVSLTSMQSINTPRPVVSCLDLLLPFWLSRLDNSCYPFRASNPQNDGGERPTFVRRAILNPLVHCTTWEWKRSADRL